MHGVQYRVYTLHGDAVLHHLQHTQVQVRPGSHHYRDQPRRALTTMACNVRRCTCHGAPTSVCRSYQRVVVEAQLLHAFIRPQHCASADPSSVRQVVVADVKVANDAWHSGQHLKNGLSAFVADVVTGDVELGDGFVRAQCVREKRGTLAADIVVAKAASSFRFSEPSDTVAVPF